MPHAWHVRRRAPYAHTISALLVGAALCAVGAAGCSEQPAPRAAEPVVRLVDEKRVDEEPGVGLPPTADDPDTLAPAGTAPPLGSKGLCEDCGDTIECSAGALCLRNRLTNERFCGQDCSGSSCPAGHACIVVQAGTILARQCAPASGSCAGQAPTDAASAPPSDPPGATSPDHDGDSDSSASPGCGPIDAMRQWNLKVLNDIRTARGLPPYARDECLDQVATAANQEWASGGPAHGKFARDCITIRPNCDCNWQQENMGYSAGTNLMSRYSYQQIIERHMNSMMAEEPYNGGHYRNIVSTTWTRVGFGIICTPTSFRLTNDFGP